MPKKLESVRLTYSRPKIYSFGSINKVQSSVQGRYVEGPDPRLYYS